MIVSPTGSEAGAQVIVPLVSEQLRPAGKLAGSTVKFDDVAVMVMTASLIAAVPKLVARTVKVCTAPRAVGSVKV